MPPFKLRDVGTINIPNFVEDGDLYIEGGLTEDDHIAKLGGRVIREGNGLFRDNCNYTGEPKNCPAAKPDGQEIVCTALYILQKQIMNNPPLSKEPWFNKTVFCGRHFKP